MMIVRVKVKTGVRREKFLQIAENAFEVQVREKPERGAANDRVRALVAGYFSVPLKNVRIVSGHHATSKLLKVIQ
ncbi:MAG: hypothetical protein UY63_C0002G0026 [Parcubacteria group bacterium GW2011_GWA2_51_10]|nr:MAG: hypothetical protein UY63_C0002G0026 [Parcubacteria group bacterium GW2011_GWA2_51_10]